MNEDNPPRETAADEPAEARIVAWVLGEASAFEAAELERLCRERPELRAFHRRMLALHGLLAETQAPGADAGWKLPAAKRRVIEERIGAPLAAAGPAAEASIRRSGRRVFYAIAACLVLTAVMARFVFVAPDSDWESARVATETIVTYQGAADESALELGVVRGEVPSPPPASPPIVARTRSAAPAAPMSVPVPAAAAAEEEGERDGFARSGIRSGDRSVVGGEIDALAEQRRKQPDPPSRPLPAQGPAAVAAAEPAPTDKVRQTLYQAEQQLGLGQLDEAKAAYEEVLRNDVGNTAARRGLERLAGAQSDYHRAAADHVRSQMLMEVDEAWSLEVPAEPPADAADRPESAVIPPGFPNPLLEELAGVVRDADSLMYLQNNTAEPPVVTKSAFGDGWSGLQLSLEDPQAEADAGAAEAEPEAAAAAPAELPAESPPADADVEVAPLDAPYSTFSLHVSAASFRIARDAIARGDRPAPEQVKPEQFYNAVDYGDPSPIGVERIAGLVEQSAHPLVPNRNLVRISLKTAAAGRSAARPLRLTLLVDQSGSMARDDRREALAVAIRQLGSLLGADDLVHVIGFSRTPRLLEEALRGDQAARLAAILGIPPDAGGTNLEEALRLAEQIALRHHDPAAQNRVVLFTDGAANLGDADPARLAGAVAAMRRRGLALDIAGIGTDGLNDRLLSGLARNGNGRYHVMTGADDPADGFARQLAGAFRPAAEDVKVQVSFNPERVAGYRLIGFEDHRLRPEDFRNDAVDAAELAAEEAGVALYQVHPLPGGRGEIGEVSVRFRDAASGETLERSWVIPYDPAAPAFDLAAPSMQLAGLAMLAAKKLRGGPLAGAIDFRNLAGPKAEVRRHFQDNGEVTDLLGIITALE
jgi:hypothetical protein